MKIYLNEIAKLNYRKYLSIMKNINKIYQLPDNIQRYIFNKMITKLKEENYKILVREYNHLSGHQYDYRPRQHGTTAKKYDSTGFGFCVEDRVV